MDKMSADKMYADETSGFKSHIPRSIRTDNLAKIIKMGASIKKKGVSAVDAFHSDHDTLGQLARLYKSEKGANESLAEEFDLALKTPVPDDNESILGFVADCSFASSDSGFITEDDFADNFNVSISYVEENHYDSLQKRSPAVLNPSYFDATRTSPSHGSGFGSARYNESAGSNNNNLRLDFFKDADSDRAIVADAAERGSTPPRDPNSLTFGVAGGAIALKRVQILDIPMPDLGILAELENADIRAGKDSPFRSYYGHEPFLSDIQEETEPESDPGPGVLTSRFKNRYQNRSHRDSIVKMESDPHAHISRTSDAESRTPSCRRPSQDMESPLSRHSKRSSIASRGQHSSILSVDTSNLSCHTAPGSLARIAEVKQDDGWETESDTAGGSLSIGFHTTRGSLSSIEEEKQVNNWWETETDNSEEFSLFATIKEPTPGVLTDFSPVESNEVSLPFDFTTSDLQPLRITSEEEKSLLNEPRFVKDGVIPQEYIRFAVLPAMGTPTHKWEPHRPDYPLRGSSLSTTVRKGKTIFLGSPATDNINSSRESEYEDELVNIFRKIREDFSDTVLGKMADAYLSHALLSNIDQAIAVAFNYELGVKGCPSIELLASAKVLYTIIACVKCAGDEADRFGNNKKAVEIYAEIGGRAFVQKELETVSSVVAKCLAESQMEVVDKDVVHERVLAQTIEADDGDPFTDRPRATSSVQSENNRLQTTGQNHAAWAQGIIGSTLDGVANAPFGFSSLASSLGMGSATLRGNIRAKEGLDLNSLLQDRSLFHFTGVGSIAPGTPAGEASRHPLPYAYHPFDGAFALIDEIVAGNTYAGGNGSSSSSSSSVDLNFTVDEVAAGPIAEFLYAEPNVFADQDGAAIVTNQVASSVTNAVNVTRHEHADIIETADDTPLASRTPQRKPGGYSLFPTDAAAPRTPSQAAERERNESQDKPVPDSDTPASRLCSYGASSILSRVPSIPKKKKQKLDGSQGLLASLNKPLPAISTAPPVDTDAEVSPIYPGLPGLEPTPIEKKQLSSMRRYGSKAIDTLKCLWSKSDQELAANQASDRERRKKSADRVINMARDYDGSRPTFPQPAAGVMMAMHAEEHNPTVTQPVIKGLMDMQIDRPVPSERSCHNTGTICEESFRSACKNSQSLNTSLLSEQNTGSARTPLRTVHAAEQNASTPTRIIIPLASNVASSAPRTPSRIPVAVRASAATEGGENVALRNSTSTFTEGVENVVSHASGAAATLGTPKPERRGFRETAVSAMGLGSRKKSIGDNTRVNGA